MGVLEVLGGAGGWEWVGGGSVVAVWWDVV